MRCRLVQIIAEEVDDSIYATICSLPPRPLRALDLLRILIIGPKANLILSMADLAGEGDESRKEKAEKVFLMIMMGSVTAGCGRARADSRRG